MKLKYIIFDNIRPVFFTETTKHCDIRIKFSRPTSAGFFDIDKGEDGKFILTAYGESVSLNLKSEKLDSKILTHAFNTRL